MDRAAQARPDFTVSARNVEAIAEICARLEGIPLALELAAARITLQTPGQLAHALRGKVTDLRSRQRGLPQRHRALRTVIQTSLNLLPAEVCSFFFALARFKGGWTMETARTATGCERCEEYLELLIASSLVEFEEDERLGVVRFSFLETVRQFALHPDSDADTVSEWDALDNLIVNGSFERDRPDARWVNGGGTVFASPFIVASGWQGIGTVNVNLPGYSTFPSGIPDGSNTAVVGAHTGAGRLFQDVAVNNPLLQGRLNSM